MVEKIYFFEYIKGKERISPMIDMEEKLINEPFMKKIAYFGRNGDSIFSLSYFTLMSVKIKIASMANAST